MPTKTRSYAKNGHNYYTNTGRYNEVTKASLGMVENDATSSLKQKKLVSKPGKKSAAAATTVSAWKELGLI